MQYPASATKALTNYESRVLAKAQERFAELLDPGAAAPEVDADGPLLLLCMTPRSGSSALSAALARSKALGLGGERLSNKPNGPLQKTLAQTPCATMRQALDWVITDSRTKNGVAQIKCDFQQIYPFIADPACLDRLQGATWVYLTREDVLGQAISRYRGFKTGMWHDNKKDAATFTDAAYDYDEIRKQVAFLSDMMGAFERTFAAIGVTPLRITYEQLTEDDTGTMHRIADRMGIEIETPVSLKDSGHKKVASSNNDALRAQFLADFKAALG